MLKENIATQLAFKVLNEIEDAYGAENKIPQEKLLLLHSIFGNVLELATELLENCKIFEYHTPNKSRSIYKIGSGTERYTIYESINFCQCQAFRHQVLENKSCLTCKHVLALKLAKITGVCKIKSEIVTESQIVEFLNEQINCIDE